MIGSIRYIEWTSTTGCCCFETCGPIRNASLGLWTLPKTNKDKDIRPQLWKTVGRREQETKLQWEDYMYFEIKYLWELSVYAAQHLEKHAKTAQSVLTDTFTECWPFNPSLGDQWECTRIQNFSHRVRSNSPVMIRITRECRVCRGT